MLTAIALGIAGGAAARLTDRSAIGDLIAPAVTLTTPMLVGVIAACVAPQPRLRWILPRATSAAALLSIATCLPWIDVAQGMLTHMPVLAIVGGLTHLVLTVTVAAMSAALAWLIRSRPA